ncbi:MAG: hypothetical protein K6B71_01115 [Alphaproteobacteria bacterium]|nr:hypothetical protein [Alphaproteobacteria bacterium]
MQKLFHNVLVGVSILPVLLIVPALADERASIFGGETIYDTDKTWSDFELEINGAAMSVGGGATVSFLGTTNFSSNVATGDGNGTGLGGGIFVNNPVGTSHLTFSGLANFTGNKAVAGGAVYNEGVITFQESTRFENNTTSSDGGALVTHGGATTNFEKDVTFLNNGFGTVNTETGGALVNNGQMLFAGTANFTGNRSTVNGTAIVNGGTMIFQKGLTLDSNIGVNGSNSGAVSSGGDIFVYGGDVDVINNTAGKAAGLFLGAGSRTFLGGTEDSVNATDENAVTNINFSGNISTNKNAAGLAVQDGAIYAKLFAENVTFENNTSNASYGGAIFNASELQILGEKNTFSNNTLNETTGGKNGGGAIHNRGIDVAGQKANLTIGRVDGSSINTFEDNTSKSFGGAIAARSADGTDQDSVVTINGQTLFDSNRSYMNGGAIWNHVIENAGTTGLATITMNGSTTFMGNVAGGLGGAIYNTGTTTINGSANFVNNMSGVEFDGSGDVVADTGTLNDIYNANVVNLNAATNQDIVFGSGITGSNGTINVNDTVAEGYTGRVVFNADVFGNDIFVADGTLDNNATIDGNVTVNGGVVDSTGVGSEIIGSVSIADGASVSAAANKIATDNASTISNEGQLTLITGDLSKDVTGGGLLIVDGTVTNSGNIANTVRINQNKSLETLAGLLGNTVENNGGTLTLTGGMLGYAVTGTGSMVVADNAYVSANATYLGNDVTNGGTLTLTGGDATTSAVLSKSVTGNGSLVVADDAYVSANATYLGNDVTNGGTLTLTGGNAATSAVLSKSVTGNGSLVVADGAYVSANATYLGNDVTNGGTLTLTGGDENTPVALSNNVTGSGSLIVNGVITNNANIENTVKINQYKSLETLAGLLGNTVENNGGTLTLTGGMLGYAVTGTGSMVVADNAYVSANAAYLGNNVTNGGTLTLTGGDENTPAVLSKSVTGTGSMVVADNAYVSANATYLGNDVTNGGTLTLTGGNTSNPVQLSHNVNGNGSLIIDGIVENTADIGNVVIINQNKSLQTAANLLGKNVTNRGVLTLTGGDENTPAVLAKSVTGNGSLVVADNAYISANATYLGNDVTNGGTLTLTGGDATTSALLSKAVTGNGSLVVADDAYVSANATYLGNNVTNGGTLTLTGGNATTSAVLSKSVTGNGSLVVADDAYVSANATYLGNEVTNGGTLTLTGGNSNTSLALSKNVTGNGLLIVNGFVNNNATITNSIQINSGKSLRTAANTIATGSNATIANSGTLTLTGGALSKNVSGNGSLVVDGAVTNTANIGNTVKINLNKSLQTAANLLGKSVTNNGTLTLTGGTLSKNVSGDGWTVVNGNVTNTGSVATRVRINSVGALTTNADNISNAITNNGQLTLTGGALAYDLVGTGTLNVLAGDELYVGTKSITQNAINLNGTMVAELDDVNDAPRFTAGTFNGYGTLQLVMREAGVYRVFGDAMFDSRLIEFLPEGITVDSPVYNLVWADDGTVSAVQKTVDEVADKNKISNGAALMTLNLMNSSSEKLNDLAVQTQTRLATNDTDAVERANRAMHPETGAVIQSIGVTNQNMISNLVAGRTTAPIAKNNYGELRRNAMWIQGVYNNSKYDGVFEGDTRGIVAGFDGTVDKILTLGAGYSFAHSDIDVTERDTDVDTLTVFLYGQYKPKAWYVDAFVNYSMFDYTEKGVVYDTKVASDYNAKSLGGQVALGYNFTGGLTPEMGVRYMHLSVDDYSNSLGIKAKIDDTNYLTAMLGTKYTHDIEISKKLLLRPELRYGLKYDMLSDRQVATISLPGVDTYEIKSDKLSRIGNELGFDFGLIYQGLDVSVGYELEIRQNFTSHTGRARIRYEF